MNTHDQLGAGDGLSAEARRRKAEIFGAVSAELGRMTRRRRLVRVGAAAGGLAACGVGAMITVRSLAPTPMVPAGPVVTLLDPNQAEPPPRVVMERLLPNPEPRMTAARFEVIRDTDAGSRVQRVSDVELLLLAAEAGKDASLIRVGGVRVIMTDNSTGGAVGAPGAEPEKGSGSEGNGPDRGGSSGRRAV